MATHSSILAWRILWTEEHIDPSGKQFHFFSLHVPPNADEVIITCTFPYVCDSLSLCLILRCKSRNEIQIEIRQELVLKEAQFKLP